MTNLSVQRVTEPATESRLHLKLSTVQPERSMSPEFFEMVSLARQYCELIEASSQDHPGWLPGISNLLPRIHAAVRALEGSIERVDGHLIPDLDARFELFTHLRELLGENDGYWLEYDRAEDDQPTMTGSLADDLTDIYCELKHGLRCLDGEPYRALAGWCQGFRCHWGQHLVDAERHLYTLEYRGCLDRRIPNP